MDPVEHIQETGIRLFDALRDFMLANGVACGPEVLNGFASMLREFMLEQHRQQLDGNKDGEDVLRDFLVFRTAKWERDQIRTAGCGVIE